MFELYETKNGWTVKPGDGDRNQTSRIFNFMMMGDTISRFTSLSIGGGIKLPSRVSEINEALASLDSSLNVSHRRVETNHGGYYFVYFLTMNQRDEINHALKGVVA